MNRFMRRTGEVDEGLPVNEEHRAVVVVQSKRVRRRCTSWDADVACTVGKWRNSFHSAGKLLKRAPELIHGEQLRQQACKNVSCHVRSQLSGRCEGLQPSFTNMVWRLLCCAPVKRRPKYWVAPLAKSKRALLPLSQKLMLGAHPMRLGLFVAGMGSVYGLLYGT